MKAMENIKITQYQEVNKKKERIQIKESYHTYISLGIVKDLSNCFWGSTLFLLYYQYRRNLN